MGRKIVTSLLRDRPHFEAVILWEFWDCFPCPFHIWQMKQEAMPREGKKLALNFSKRLPVYLHSR